MTPATHVEVRTASAKYTVAIGKGVLSEVGTKVADLLKRPAGTATRQIFAVSSPAIKSAWGKILEQGFADPLRWLMVPAGEEHKRMTTIASLAEQMAEAGADRDSLLLAFGGGVVGDMTGYLAASYMRGIRYIQVPTTLLAQVDSSIGGKTGVNLAAGKNLVGAFYQPLAVYADVDVLSTLPSAELRAGLQESIKAGIIRDAELFAMLESESEAVLRGDPESLLRVVAASVRVKADVVAADEREGDLRMILNLGHTLGHAIEAATGYTALLHGEAVAWGMLAAAAIAKRRGMLTDAEHDRVERVVKLYGPLKRFHADAADLVARTARDKKNRGGTRSFVLPRGIGDAVVVNDVSEAELMFTAKRMMAMVSREDVA